MLLFHIGKGGVGKSTLSSMTALAAADAGTDTLLVSLDPAHNISDIFGEKLDDSDRRVAPRLLAREIDVQGWLRRYLRDVELEMQRNYTYLTAMNLDRHFRVLRHAPGMEEFALSLAFRDILRRHERTGLVIFDMPPTALALRFFAAPSIALSWTEELTALRRMMLEKKQIATRIRFGKAEFERDRVLKRLEDDRHQHQREQHLFRDRSRTLVRVICNGDMLSLQEGARIFNELEQLGIHPDMLLLNRCGAMPELPERIAGIPSVIIPESKVPLHGLGALRASSGALTPILPQHDGTAG